MSMDPVRHVSAISLLGATFVFICSCSTGNSLPESELAPIPSEMTSPSASNATVVPTTASTSTSGLTDQSQAGVGSSGVTASGTTSSVSDSPTTTVDPNAIPDAPPPIEIASTSRLARLSRKQWSNSVKQLLRMDDLADIDAQVSGDALIGFDTEGDALYVTEQLRRELEGSQSNSRCESSAVRVRYHCSSRSTPQRKPPRERAPSSPTSVYAPSDVH